jgi:hypothetical protein
LEEKAKVEVETTANEILLKCDENSPFNNLRALLKLAWRAG